MDCTFEQDTCAYFQLTDDEFDWTRHQQATPSSSSGRPLTTRPVRDGTCTSKHRAHIFKETVRAYRDLHKTRLGNRQSVLHFGCTCMGPILTDSMRIWRGRGYSDVRIYTKYGTQGNVWFKAGEGDLD